MGSFPSITELPVLGYTYYDLYREAKIRETVYEFLTQQYELAKVQEAKELPTVRVMDPAVKPERKSAPRRTLIVGLSVFGASDSGWIYLFSGAAHGNSFRQTIHCAFWALKWQMKAGVSPAGSGESQSRKFYALAE